MIRFCDTEIYYVAEREWDSWAVITFLNTHRKECVCLHDHKGRFVGATNYRRFVGEMIKVADKEEGQIPFSFLEEGLWKSIRREYLVLDKNIWKNGRKCFRNCPKDIYGTTLLPVVDENLHLVCFAWQDDEANREVRMLEELISYGNSMLGFKDVFPQYDCVTVHG